MASTRRPFDPAGPFVVAVTELVTPAGKLRRGQSMPTSGVSDLDLRLMWVALQIDVADPVESAAAAASSRTSASMSSTKRNPARAR